MKKTYKVKTKLWIWPSESGAWHFVTLPKALSAKIKAAHTPKVRRGFGSIKVKATIGKTSFATSIFPAKDGAYLLPVKASVRKKEAIFQGDTIDLTLFI